MKIITVTLNPSLDRTLTVHYLAVGYENQVIDGSVISAAGRGMNISSAVRMLGTETEAIVLLGTGPISRAYEALLLEYGFPVRVVRFEGRIRSSIFIKDTGSGQETIIKEECAEVPPEIFRRVEDMLRERIEPNDYVVFAGGLPLGANADTYAGLATVAKEAGARVVLDTEGESLRQGIQAKPTLVMLDQLRIERYFNFPVRVEKDVIYCARKLQEEGALRVMIILNDYAGAILATEDQILKLEYPEEIRTGTRSGVYDAMLAGYLRGRLKEHSLDSALELGGAAAIYAATQIGTEFGTLRDIKEFLWEVNAKPIEPSE